MHKTIVTLLAFIVVTGRAHGEGASWKEYVNRRFGFSLRYPATLIASRAPENGAGREFHTVDKEFSVLAEGHFLRVDEGDSLDKRWQDELDSFGDTITYKKKTDTWLSSRASPKTEPSITTSSTPKGVTGLRLIPLTPRQEQAIRSVDPANRKEFRSLSQGRVRPNRMNGAYLLFAQFARMTQLVKTNEALDPIAISSLSAQAVMF